MTIKDLYTEYYIILLIAKVETIRLYFTVPVNTPLLIGLYGNVR